MKWIHLIYILLALLIVTAGFYFFYPKQAKHTTTTHKTKTTAKANPMSVDLKGVPANASPIVGDITQKTIEISMAYTVLQKLDEGGYAMGKPTTDKTTDISAEMKEIQSLDSLHKQIVDKENQMQKRLMTYSQSQQGVYKEGSVTDLNTIKQNMGEVLQGISEQKILIQQDKGYLEHTKMALTATKINKLEMDEYIKQLKKDLADRNTFLDKSLAVVNQK